MRNKLLTFSFVAVLSIAHPVAGQNLPALTIVTGANYGPFTDPDLPGGGLAVEIVTAVFDEAGVALKSIDFPPWKRGYSETLNHKADATFPYMKTPEREAAMLFSESIYDVRSVAVFASDTGYDFAGFDSLKGLTICLPLGYATPVQPLINKGDVRIAAQPQDSSQCLKTVVAHHADFFIENEFTVLRLIQEQNAEKNVRIAATAVNSFSNHLIVAKDHPRANRIIAAFNDGLARLKATGRYDEIVTRLVLPSD